MVATDEESLNASAAYGGGQRLSHAHFVAQSQGSLIPARHPSEVILTRKAQGHNSSISNHESDLSRHLRELRSGPSGFGSWTSVHCEPVTTMKLPT